MIFALQEEDDGESSAFALTGDQWKMLYMIAEYSSLSNDRVNDSCLTGAH